MVSEREPSDAILATAVVPWTPDFEFDEEVFCRHIGRIAGSLTKQIYVFGTAGEGYAIDDRQFERIARVFGTCAREHGVNPILGLISLSLRTIISRIECGIKLGFRNFQISLPAWGALNDWELNRFFAETCGRFPNCSFHHYNLRRAGRLLTAADYARVASAHPNFVAIKSSATDPAVVADLLTISPRLRIYFTEIGYAVARRTTDDVGLLISLASINFGRAWDFVQGTQVQREKEITNFGTMIEELQQLAAGRFHMDGAFDKMLARFSDPGFPLDLLPPYASATEADWVQFKSRLPADWQPAE